MMMRQEHVFFRLVPSTADYTTAVPVSMAAIRADRAGKVISAFSTPINEDTKLETVLGMLSDQIERQDSRYIVVAHNAEFERHVLRNAAPNLFKGRRWIDLSQLLFPFVENGLLNAGTLDTAAAYFGATLEPKRSAANDVTCIMQIYLEVMKRYRVGLHCDDGIRDLGGDTLKALGKFIGF